MDTTQETDCAVCMQKYNHPAKLPCEHIFCFLCVKGVMRRSHNCPMCRTRIPIDYLDNPVFVNDTEQELNECEDDKYWWYYEGKDGWWSYDERSNEDLEADYNSGKSECKLLVAGAVYCVDFSTMIQYQLNDPRRKRKVKRDTHKHPSKGIAGIRKINQTQHSNSNNNSSSYVSQNITSNQDHSEIFELESLAHSLRVMSLQAEDPDTSSSDPGNT